MVETPDTDRGWPTQTHEGRDQGRVRLVSKGSSTIGACVDAVLAPQFDPEKLWDYVLACFKPVRRPSRIDFA
jgi:hypothetical protein